MKTEIKGNTPMRGMAEVECIHRDAEGKVKSKEKVMLPATWTRTAHGQIIDVRVYDKPQTPPETNKLAHSGAKSGSDGQNPCQNPKIEQNAPMSAGE